MEKATFTDDPPERQRKTLIQKENLMKKIIVSRKAIYKSLALALVATFVFAGGIKIYEVTYTALNRYAYNRVASNPALKAQFVETVRQEVQIPVIKTEDVQKAVEAAKEGAKQGAIDGTDKAIQQQLK